VNQPVGIRSAPTEVLRYRLPEPCRAGTDTFTWILNSTCVGDTGVATPVTKNGAVTSRSPASSSAPVSTPLGASAFPKPRTTATGPLRTPSTATTPHQRGSPHRHRRGHPRDLRLCPRAPGTEAAFEVGVGRDLHLDGPHLTDVSRFRVAGPRLSVVASCRGSVPNVAPNRGFIPLPGRVQSSPAVE
jgi:hypothetical protein